MAANNNIDNKNKLWRSAWKRRCKQNEQGWRDFHVWMMIFIVMYANGESKHTREWATTREERKKQKIYINQKRWTKRKNSIKCSITYIYGSTIELRVTANVNVSLWEFLFPFYLSLSHSHLLTFFFLSWTLIYSY